MIFYFFLTLFSALLHASWNSLIKSGKNRVLSMAVMNITEGIGGVIVVLIFGFPEMNVLFYLVTSVLLRLFYKMSLLAAYRYGDLSIVYPIARGISPVLATLGASVFAKEFIPILGLFGIFTIAAGIIFQISGKQTATTIRKETIIYSLICGFLIACYTIVDGLGARTAENENSYIGALFMSEFFGGAVFWAYNHIKQGKRTPHLIKKNVLGGVFSFGAYSLVILSAVHLPMGIVSAVRESGIIFATLIGVFLLGESAKLRRIISSVIVCSGLAILLLQVSGIF